MRTRQRSIFLTVMSEGALLPIDVLQRVAQCESSLGGREECHRPTPIAAGCFGHVCLFALSGIGSYQ